MANHPKEVEKEVVVYVDFVVQEAVGAGDVRWQFEQTCGKMVWQRQIAAELGRRPAEETEMMREG